MVDSLWDQVLQTTQRTQEAHTRATEETQVVAHTYAWEHTHGKGRTSRLSG